MEKDSELIESLWALLEKHDVPEGLREMIVDIVARWEIEEA